MTLALASMGTNAQNAERCRSHCRPSQCRLFRHRVRGSAWHRFGLAICRQHRFPRRGGGQFFLILFALAWSVLARARVGMALAGGILLVPGLATLSTAFEKLLSPLPPAPLPMSTTGFAIR